MQVTVHFYGHLGFLTGRKEGVLSFQENAVAVGMVLAAAAKTWPKLKNAVGETGGVQPSLLMSVNGVIAGNSSLVKDGDQLQFFPLVGGG